MSRVQLAKLPVLSLPVQHNDSLLAREISRRKPGRPQTFAVSLPVHLTPEDDGKWVAAADYDRWRMRVKSAGAKSLNLGFTRFVLPEGAALYLSNDQQRYGPFTAADNEDHAQLWTPLLRGDEVLLELEVPPGRKEAVELVLSTVNHDFEGAIDLLSGDCHVDVACGAAEGYPQVDDHRDVIRSVAAYTVEGRERCTGFLVNNTNQDGRPLFLTANHCGVNEETAPTLVAYWNFENETCRLPGSTASGSAGNGTLDVYNTGARLLASYAATDMTLVELDEPVNPRARAFFAGWNALDNLPNDGVFTVHHPNLDEKRISFSDRAVTRSTIVGEASSSGNFLRVAQWDLGSTEGGSSGAPLFDPAGRVRGQLFGGRATCGTQAEDMFGWLQVSWTGGGSPATRLMDWLDPCGRSAGTLSGLDEADLARTLVASRGCQDVCVAADATFEFTLGTAFPDETTLTVVSDGGLNWEVPPTVDGGQSFTLSVSAVTVDAGSYPIEIVASGGQYRSAVTIILNVTVAPPPAVIALRPADNGTGLDPSVELAWRPVSNAESYQLQYSLTPDFTAVAANLTELAETTYTPTYPLPGETRYFWRVRAQNACGNGTWSAVRSFTTDTRTCLVRRGMALPVPIPSGDPSEVVAALDVAGAITPADLEIIVGIEHTFLGDLEAKLVSPDGVEVKLFDPLSDGSCPARNLYVIFADDASITAEQFSERCEDGSDTDYLRVRPLEPLADLLDQNAGGTWKLVVNDRAAMDGGAITDFRIRICENRVDRRDLDVEVVGEALTACANEGGTATLRLGADFTDEIALRVEAGGLELDNYTFSHDVGAHTVGVRFSAWTLAGVGTQELAFTVIAADGTERQALNTLTVLPLPEPVTPLAARIGAERVTFRWRGSGVAETYTLEVSPTEQFGAPALVALTRNRQITLPRGDLPETFYWRVVGNNSCGSFPGPSRAMAADTANAVHTIDAGQSIVIYPNPTHGEVRLELQGAWPDRQMQAVLFGADGRQVARWPDVRALNHRLQMEGIPAGVYFLRVTGSFGGITERLLLLR